MSKPMFIFRHAMAFVLYWVCIFIVPFLLLLWNAISRFLVTGIDEGSLMWYVFLALLQPAAVIIATLVTVKIAPTHKHVWVIINSVLCVCLFAVLLFFSAVMYNPILWEDVIKYLLSIVAVIIMLVKYKDLEQETEIKSNETTV